MALIYSIGGNDQSTTFQGRIVNGGQAGSSTGINKVGNGTLTLTGSSNYTGATSVTGGTLCVTGALSNTSAVEVSNGGTLCLQNGVVTVGNVHIAGDGNLTGWGRINGNLTNDGMAACGSGGTLTVTGAVTNNGTMLFTGGTLLTATGSFVNNGVFDIITSAQPLPPNFVNNGIVLDSGAVKVLQAVKAGTSFSVTIQSYVGHGYQLQSKAALTSGSWTNTGAAQDGTGDVLLLTDTAVGNSSRGFYRVYVSP